MDCNIVLITFEQKRHMLCEYRHCPKLSVRICSLLEKLPPNKMNVLLLLHFYETDLSTFEHIERRYTYNGTKELSDSEK